MKKVNSSSSNQLGARAQFKKLPLSVLCLAISGVTLAQSNDPDATQVPGPIEEVMVLGRLATAAESLTIERMDSDTVVDLLGFEQMSRVGDSNIAAALTRVPGITLIGGKFVYVRGLGERYSSTLLNGATVPSPDLTRNVLPLDIFPTSIVESVAIQKSYSPDLPGAFGGGNINIRTKSIPDDLVASVEIGIGSNTSSDRVFSYSGGSDDKYGKDDGTRSFSPELDTALRTYRSSFEAEQPSLSPAAIQDTLRANGEDISLEQARAINAQLATEFNRTLSVQEESESLNDVDANISLGNRFYIGSDWELGAIGSLSYDTSSRTDQRIDRFLDITASDEFKDRTQSVKNVSITGVLNSGIRKGDDHSVDLKNLFLRNTDDEVSITNTFNTTAPFGSGQGIRNYGFRYEQRQLRVNQISGSHRLGGDTLDLLGLESGWYDDAEFEWFYSDSTSETDIPSETTLQATISTDNAGVVTSSVLRGGPRLANIQFSKLKDQVKSSGVKISVPIVISDFDINLTFGNKYDRQARTFAQADFSFGPQQLSANESLSGDITTALSDENITNPDYRYETIYQSGLSRSYIAATTTDALFGDISVTWDDTWKVSLGSRYEKYQLFTGVWDPYRRKGSQLRLDTDNLTEGEVPNGIFAENDAFTALSLTYMTQGFGAEDFQLRFGYSNTAVRPDLREVSPADYRDPITLNNVQGNPDVVPSKLTNYDIRGEWYFSGGDTLTASLFYKDIDDPIETFQTQTAEDSVSFTVLNAQSGYSRGLEVEWLKSLDFLGGYASQFFTAGNVTIADSEIDANNLTIAATNRKRPLTGASEYVVNFQLGYDSDNGEHSATLAYNVFGERIFVAGVDGVIGDAYEQPVNSLNMSYSYYPTDTLTVKLKANNLLDENEIITQGPDSQGNDVNVFERNNIGQSFSLSVSYKY